MDWAYRNGVDCSIPFPDSPSNCVNGNGDRSGILTCRHSTATPISSLEGLAIPLFVVHSHQQIGQFPFDRIFQPYRPGTDEQTDGRAGGITQQPRQTFREGVRQRDRSGMKSRSYKQRRINSGLPAGKAPLHGALFCSRGTSSITPRRPDQQFYSP